MSFRRRITLASAAAVAIAVVLASVLTYVLTSDQLHGQVDAQLRNRADRPARSSSGQRTARAARAGCSTLLAARSAPQARRSSARDAGPERTRCGNVARRGPNQVRGYQQLVERARHGRCSARAHGRDAAGRRRARARWRPARARASSATRRVNGIHLRILAEHFAPRRAVQFAQPLTEVDNLLGRLRLILALLDLGGIALAALLGRLVAGAAVLPVKRLTQATEHVAAHAGPDGRIEPVGRRRDRAAGGELQRDARRARALDERARRVRARAAPARRRRLARAAHPGDEPAHEHRDPPAGQRHGPRRARSACWTTWSSRSRS